MQTSYLDRLAETLKLDQHVENIRNTPEPSGAAGLFSMIGLTALVSFLAFHFGGFTVLLHDLPGFLTGHALEMTRGNDTMATGLATIVLMLVVSMASLLIVAATAGKTHGEHAVGKEMANMQSGNQFGSLLFVVLLEELLARGLFLGLLTKLPFLSGTGGFYAMFLLGNAAWAAIHLTNFTNPEDRSLWRVLPQFLGGVCITYIFVKYGFLAGFVVHLGFDALLFSTHKREKTTSYDVASTIYAGLIALVAYFLMSKQLSDIAPWFQTGSATFKLAGWNFWDYLKVDVCLTGVLTVVSGVLLFDTPQTDKEAADNATNPLMVALGSVIAVGFFFGFYWLLGLVFHSTDVKVLVVGLAFACLQKGRSGSSVARAFWFSIPDVFISLCVMEALGFRSAIFLVLASYVIHLPTTLIRRQSA